MYKGPCEDFLFLHIERTEPEEFGQPWCVHGCGAPLNQSRKTVGKRTVEGRKKNFLRSPQRERGCDVTSTLWLLLTEPRMPWLRAGFGAQTQRKETGRLVLTTNTLSVHFSPLDCFLVMNLWDLFSSPAFCAVLLHTLKIQQETKLTKTLSSHCRGRIQQK